jgi:hypothetical protein
MAEILNINENGNCANRMLATVKSQLDKWIEQCEEQAEVFRLNKMDTAEISSQAMAQAYWNVKQLIEVNGC